MSKSNACKIRSTTITPKILLDKTILTWILEDCGRTTQMMNLPKVSYVFQKTKASGINAEKLDRKLL